MAAIAGTTKTKPKTACQYGSKCYRRNPQHLRDYSHPGEDDKDRPRSVSPDEPKPGRQKRTITDFFSSNKIEEQASLEAELIQNSKKQKLNTHTSDDGDDDSGRTDQDFGGQASSGSDLCDATDDSESRHIDQSAEKPPTYPEDVKDCIRQLFLLEMPEDFYQFWDFCKASNKKDPSSSLVKTLGLKLSGPYDILSGRHKSLQKNKRGKYPNFLLHQRFFYDPPEFQTVLVSEEASQFHIGYFRDEPKDMPVFMASNTPGANSSAKEKITSCGDNIFAAVYLYATQRSKSEKGQTKKQIDELKKELEEAAEKLNLSLAANTKCMKERQKKVNCPTFHAAGMVVPVDANDVGYRPVPETQKDLKAMLKRICDGDTEAKREEASEELQEIITFVQFANDECDYGEGLELGLCLFSYGRKELHPQISLLLPLAYQLLGRPQYQQIIEEHLKRRTPTKGCVDELEV